MHTPRPSWFVGALLLLSSAPAVAAPVELGDLVSAELVVTDHASRRVPVPLSTPATCEAGAHCIVGGAHDPSLTISLSVGPGMRALPIEIDAEVLQPMAVRQISLRLAFAASAFSLLGRDYAATTVPSALLDRFDPKWVTLRDHGRSVASLIIDDDVDSARVSMDHGRVVVELQLFSSAARPFGHLPRCGHVWRDIHGRVALPDRFLHAGEHLVASGELVLGPSTAVALSPWPSGRAAAFVITDHADQSSAATLHALLGGSSDADLDHPTGGLLFHGIPITKALFLRGAARHGGARPQLEDPAVQALADRMRAAGSEVVPHSATPLPDLRAATDLALAWFGQRGARTWIDHQPQTNCEGFNQSGWHTRTGIADLLQARGFRYVWDLTEWTGTGLDERDPHHLDRAAATVWPLGRVEPNGPEHLWMFRSTWAFIPTPKFFARYAPSELDRLERDRGIHIAHTYLETLHPKRTFFGQRNLMLRSLDGRVTIDAKFDAFLADLHKRSERGSMWVSPLGPLADRLRAMQGVRVRVTEEGLLSVARPAGLDDVTVHVGASADFAPAPLLAGQASRDGTSRAWLQRCPDDAACTTSLALIDATGAPLSLFNR